MTNMTKLLSAIAAAVTLALCAPAYAQKQAVKFPKGLKWKAMPYAAFNAPAYSENTSSPELRKEAETIWSKELDALPTSSFNKFVNGEPVDEMETRKYPAFVLIEKHESNDAVHVFSIMDSGGYDGCIIDKEYASCTLRVVTKNKKTGKTHQRDYPKFCAIPFFEEGEEDSRTEFAIDQKSQTVYFRTISLGDVAPECNRSLRLQ